VRRIFWVAAGLGAGVAGAILAGRWTRKQAERMAPANLAREAGSTIRDAASLGTEALREFRRGMSEKEAEVRASLPT